jgi:hypothetical protein
VLRELPHEALEGSGPQMGGMEDMFFHLNMYVVFAGIEHATQHTSAGVKH